MIKMLGLFIARPGSGLGALLSLSLVGCQSPNYKSSVRESLDSSLNSEVSLKEDRKHLDNLRSELPQEVKKANDELAYDLNLMGEVKEHPSKIREKFQSKVRKMRQDFRNQTQKVRDQYNKEERQQRDEFLKKALDQRERFRNSKPDKEKSKEFYAEQDLARKDYFASERDERKEFESEMRTRSKDFDDAVKQRNDQFNDQLRVYTQRYQDHQKEIRDQKTSSKSRDQSATRSNSLPNSHQSDLNEMSKVPATPLGSGESDD